MSASTSRANPAQTKQQVVSAPPSDTVYDMLARPSIINQVKAALPQHLTAARILRVATTTLRRTPELGDCDPLSLVGCIIQAAGLGLEIDSTLGHAYMVPFRNHKNGNRREAQLIVGYKGFLALAHRSGKVSHFSAHVVHKNDAFKFANGSHAFLEHIPTLDDPGEPIAVYAVIRTIDGAHDHEVIGWRKILECQKKYGTRGGPWTTHLEEMARKTAIRALAKRAPLSAEIGAAAGLDSMAEADQPQNLAALVEMSAGDRVLTRIAAQGLPDDTPADSLPAEGD